jgi:glycosyltransferase involved in cell wall biosynthesis
MERLRTADADRFAEERIRLNRTASRPSLRVLHVVTNLGTYGAERFVGRLAEHLAPAGLDVAVMALAPSPPGAACAVPRLEVGRRGRYDVLFLPRMVALMRRWRPDVVHTHMHHGKYWGRLAALAARVPAIVHTEHNSEFGAPQAFRPVGRFLTAHTAAIVAFSQTHRAALAADEQIPLERIEVIPNGIDLAPPPADARARVRAELGVADADAVLMHVGRLAHVKNQRLAVEALALLPRNVRLVLVGDGVDRALLAQLAAERGVAERVTFLGFRDDAARLIAGADVALVTSRNEAMPLAVIEAMAAGVPLVSTPWKGASEMLHGGAYGAIAPDYAATSLARAVRGALDDPAAAAERAERERRFALAEYDIATTARRYADLYVAVSEPMRAAKSRITAARS